MWVITARRALAATAACWVLTRWIRRNLRVVTVTGTSMLPDFRHGDLLLVRCVRPGAIRPGDVIVLDTGQAYGHRPSAANWIIKRVAATPGDAITPGIVPGCRDSIVPAGQLILLGDNPEHSTDSRQHGYYPASRAIGRVITLPAPARADAVSRPGSASG